jgi:hypothetical protein
VLLSDVPADHLGIGSRRLKLQERKMINSASRAGWDIALLGIPLLALLVFGFFRLDEVFTSRKQGAALHGPTPNQNRPKTMRSDPDGRPWDDN